MDFNFKPTFLESGVVSMPYWHEKTIRMQFTLDCRDTCLGKGVFGFLNEIVIITDLDFSNSGFSPGMGDS